MNTENPLVPRLVTEDNTVDVIAQLEKAFWDIPFENSDFQTEKFVIAAQITPERAYRAIGLRLLSKLQVVRNAQFAARKRNIKLGELRDKLTDANTTKWDKELAQVEIEEIESGINYSNKLLNDAIRELNVLYAHFEKLPKFTREQFEAAEETYFTQSLVRQIKGIAGAQASLANMHEDSKALLEYEQKVSQMVALDSATLEDLRLQMSNLVENQPKVKQQLTK